VRNRCEFDGKDRCEGQKGHTKLVVGCGSDSDVVVNPSYCACPVHLALSKNQVADPVTNQQHTSLCFKPHAHIALMISAVIYPFHSLANERFLVAIGFFAFYRF
jgi:hypothetical protein